LANELAAAWPDSRIKMLATVRALGVRSRLENLFAHGEYLPLETTGKLADHLIAFARRDGDEWTIVVTPRHPQRLLHEQKHEQKQAAGPGWRIDWGDAAVVLPAEAGRQWQSELSGEKLEARSNDDTLTLAANELFAALPVALLTKTAGTRPAARSVT
jgi:(1->4)-alpha-D-glucan 1-alpha-D-glucosylmutase